MLILHATATLSPALASALSVGGVSENVINAQINGYCAAA